MGEAEEDREIGRPSQMPREIDRKRERERERWRGESEREREREREREMKKGAKEGETARQKQKAQEGMAQNGPDKTKYAKIGPDRPRRLR